MTTRADTAGKQQNGSGEFDKLTDVIEDTATAARTTAHNAVEKGREVLAQGREVAAEFGGATQEYVSRNAGMAYRGARDTAEQVSKNTVDFVRERPLSALAIAAGIGVVGALLFSRRRR